jgi:hypothetical protein
MSTDPTFTPLDLEQLREQLQTFSINDLLAVTLKNGDILLGGLFNFWEDIWDDEGCVAIIFNTDKGTQFGDSNVVHVPHTLISCIAVVPLDDASLPKLDADSLQAQFFKQIGIELNLILPPKDYPNPLASIICEHNLGVVKNANLDVGIYVEKALSEEGIPPEGIHFGADFLIYADWQFFSTQAGGSFAVSAVPIPGLNIGKNFSKSPEQQVLQRLRVTRTEQLRKRVSPSIGNYVTIEGCLLVPEPAQDTEIEGDLCYLYRVAESKEDGQVYPLLIKAKRLKYPLEFVNRINSILTIYGELMAMPVSILGENYAEVLVARAIAYLTA